MTAFTTDSLLQKIQRLASRPLAEFNKYVAFEMVDALQKAAHDSGHEKEAYFRLAFETLRSKLGHSHAMFRNYLLPLFGD